jgi:hypothetical protein
VFEVGIGDGFAPMTRAIAPAHRNFMRFTMHQIILALAAALALLTTGGTVGHTAPPGVAPMDAVLPTGL